MTMPLLTSFVDKRDKEAENIYHFIIDIVMNDSIGRPYSSESDVTLNVHDYSHCQAIVETIMQM